jgi:DNA-binding transcriptional regulator YiaG
MTGHEVHAIRTAIANALVRNVSQRDLGIALGLAPENADRTIRKWEDEGPSGPGAVALRLMQIALSDDPVAGDGFVRDLFSSPQRDRG